MAYTCNSNTWGKIAKWDNLSTLKGSIGTAGFYLASRPLDIKQVQAPARTMFSQHQPHPSGSPIPPDKARLFTIVIMGWV